MPGCADCEHWRDGPGFVNGAEDGVKACTRFPPSVVPMPDGSFFSAYPITLPEMTCGELTVMVPEVDEWPDEAAKDRVRIAFDEALT